MITIPLARMNGGLLNIALLLIVMSAGARAADGGAIVDGPGYAFTIAAPKGWTLISTKQLQAAFHPADTTFEKSAVIMYVRSANKQALHVANIAELNGTDLKGIQERNPKAVSEKSGTIKTPLGVELPMYTFSGGGYSELVAYADEGKTITVFVVSADKAEQLQAARKAFDELIASYVFLTDQPKAPNRSKKPAGLEPSKK